MLSGSYRASDVTFLLTPIALELTAVDEKEAAIQRGARHYSEMLSPELPPSEDYFQLFHAAMERNLDRFAGDLLELALAVHHAHPRGEIVLLSLARAGTPIGVLLARILRARFERAVAHYSISIIRDRGIDAHALRFVLGRHAAESVCFVDGWTGKGVIARELARSVRRFNEAEGTSLPVGLAAVADLCGAAVHAATHDDYLIPSSILGGVVSGLVSRSVLNDLVPRDGFHGCVRLDHLAPFDRSAWFVDEVERAAARLAAPGPRARDRGALARRIGWLEELTERHGGDENLVKPGIGEATRVLLRRRPGLLLLARSDDPDTAHLRVLAEDKGVVIREEPNMPYRAVSIIERLVS